MALVLNKRRNLVSPSIATLVGGTVKAVLIAGLIMNGHRRLKYLTMHTKYTAAERMATIFGKDMLNKKPVEGVSLTVIRYDCHGAVSRNGPTTMSHK
jgi:hypothetical protein